ncbi:MAG: hypothetical protein PVH61_30855 [Candidatus Aminicenantes bacterium]
MAKKIKMRNPWIIQLITENPDNKKLKEELVKYFNNHAAWEQEKQEKLNHLTETGNTENELDLKKQHITALKLEVVAWESEINNITYMTVYQLKAANAEKQALLTEHMKKDTLIDSLKLLLQHKNAIILELESALQMSNTLSQSNHLFYTNEFQLRYIANGILKDADDNMEKTNLFTIGIGGYYDPWNKTYGAGIFVGIDIRKLLNNIL